MPPPASKLAETATVGLLPYLDLDQVENDGHVIDRHVSDVAMTTGLVVLVTYLVPQSMLQLQQDLPSTDKQNKSIEGQSVESMFHTARRSTAKMVILGHVRRGLPPSRILLPHITYAIKPNLVGLVVRRTVIASSASEVTTVWLYKNSIIIIVIIISSVYREYKITCTCRSPGIPCYSCRTQPNGAYGPIP